MLLCNFEDQQSNITSNTIGQFQKLNIEPKNPDMKEIILYVGVGKKGQKQLMTLEIRIIILSMKEISTDLKFVVFQNSQVEV